jgi:hypothetical protein
VFNARTDICRDWAQEGQHEDADDWLDQDWGVLITACKAALKQVGGAAAEPAFAHMPETTEAEVDDDRPTVRPDTRSPRVSPVPKSHRLRGSADVDNPKRRDAIAVVGWYSDIPWTVESPEETENFKLNQRHRTGPEVEDGRSSARGDSP